MNPFCLILAYSTDCSKLAPAVVLSGGGLFLLAFQRVLYIVPYMDTNKWKSVLMARWMYEEIVAIAHIEGRTISGQLRFMFEEWKGRNLSKSDMLVVKAKIVENRQAEADALKAAEQAEIDQEIEEAFTISGIQSLSPKRRLG